MTERTIEDRVKTRLNGNEIEAVLLEDLVEDATYVVLSSTMQEKLNSALERVVVHVVVTMINRLGTEGVGSESYSGVSYSYLDDLPPNMQSILNANRRLGAWDDDDDTE